MLTAFVVRPAKPHTFEEILAEEIRAFGEKHLAQDRTLFWRALFVRWYGEEPDGNSDPRWDELFKSGMPLLREALGCKGFKA